MKRNLWRRDWLLALSGLYRLSKNHKDLRAVLDIIIALEANGLKINYSRMRQSSEGRPQLLEQRELSEILRNWTWLETFPPGTVARAYLEFMQKRKLDSKEVTLALLAGRYGESLKRNNNSVAWFSRHVADTHDILHVLTGYDTDSIGEVCTQAFTFAQVGSWGYAAIAIGGSFIFGPLPFWEAWRRGRKAKCLFHLNIESLLSKPLSEARASLELKPPRFYHSVAMI